MLVGVEVMDEKGVAVEDSSLFNTLEQMLETRYVDRTMMCWVHRTQI
jgi:hypothetical protein